MLPERGESLNRQPFGYDKPSNSLFLPPEYRSVNCWVCGDIISGATVSSVGGFVNQPTKFNININGTCQTSNTWEHWIRFGDGGSTLFYSNNPTSTEYTYRSTGLFGFQDDIACNCPSPFSFFTVLRSLFIDGDGVGVGDGDGDGACATDPPTSTVPTSVSSVTYNEVKLLPPATSRAWGAVTIYDSNMFTIDIDAYYDSGENTWKPKVTKANSSYDIWWRNLVQEASHTRATAANCEQMISDLNSLNPPIAPDRWYMVDAVKAHEYVHVSEWKAILTPKFKTMKMSIESLSVPHTCGRTKAEAKNMLKALDQYTTAYNKALNDADSEWPGGHSNGAAAAAERAVVDEMIFLIKAKGNINPNWPAACKS